MNATTLRALLLLPLTVAMGACEEDEPTAPAGPTVVQVAQEVNAETGEFSTLLAAVTRAGLAGELSGSGQRTVFAPTDAAFEAIDLDATSIAAVPLDDLREILLYHVAPGRYAAAAVTSRNELAMANGGTVQVRVEGGAAYVNDARILTADVDAENGIIHVIDAVLLP